MVVRERLERRAEGAVDETSRLELVLEIVALPLSSFLIVKVRAVVAGERSFPGI